jgi:hypothetical protein
MRRVWQVGLLISAMLTGLVGHQGGELSYGERLYHDAFDRLLGREPGAKASEPAGTEEKAVADSNVASS